VENSQRYLEHCLHFDFPICILLWLKRNRGKDFSIRLRIYMIIKRNYAGNKPKSYKIMKMHMFATLDNGNRHSGNIRGLNLASVKHMIVEVTRLLL
jgi:hypothetical protein